MEPRIIASHAFRTALFTVLLLVLHACAAQAPLPEDTSAAPPPSAGRAALQIRYDGHSDSRGNLVEDGSRGTLVLRYLVDGELLGEHNVGAWLRIMARLQAGPHRLTIQGSERGSAESLFTNEYEIVLEGGAEAVVGGSSRDYLTGKTRKNLMMQRWDREMTLVYGITETSGFGSVSRTSGAEEAILRTLWIQE